MCTFKYAEFDLEIKSTNFAGSEKHRAAHLLTVTSKYCLLMQEQATGSGGGGGLILGKYAHTSWKNDCIKLF